MTYTVVLSKPFKNSLLEQILQTCFSSQICFSYFPGLWSFTGWHLNYSRNSYKVSYLHHKRYADWTRGSIPIYNTTQIFLIAMQDILGASSWTYILKQKLFRFLFKYIFLALWWAVYSLQENFHSVLYWLLMFLCNYIQLPEILRLSFKVRLL